MISEGKLIELLQIQSKRGISSFNMMKMRTKEKVSRNAYQKEMLE
jgi:hypothetical protein